MAMKTLGLSLLAVCFFLTAAAISTRADQFNEKTIFTFSGPVEIPGFHGPMVLPAGTYVFQLLDSMSDRNIVQIFNKDQTHVYATILAIPDYRLTPAGKTIITFEERAEGSPQAIRAWFYPGDNYGQEFVYPKPRAIEIAKANNEPVLSIPEETAKEPAAQALEKAHVTAEKPNGQEVEAAEVVQTKPPGNLEAKNESKALPRTAGDMPLAVLCGILLLGMGVGFRLVSRKLA
jgi:hypothetical protein